MGGVQKWKVGQDIKIEVWEVTHVLMAIQGLLVLPRVQHSTPPPSEMNRGNPAAAPTKQSTDNCTEAGRDACDRSGGPRARFMPESSSAAMAKGPAAGDA